MNRSALNVFLNLAMDFDLIHCRGYLTGVSEMHGRGGLGDFPFPTTFVFVSWWRGNCSFPICWRGRSVMGTLTGARSHAFPPGGLGSTPPAAELLLHFPVSVPRASLILPSPFPPSMPLHQSGEFTAPAWGLVCFIWMQLCFFFFLCFIIIFFLILTVELESNAWRRRRFAECAVGCALQLCVSATEQMLRLHPRGDQGLEARPVLAAW